MHSPYRKDGYIPRLKSNRYPKRWIFFDTETYDNQIDEKYTELKLKLGYAIYIELDKTGKVKKRKEYLFKTPNEFIDILLEHDRKKQRVMVVAHNVKFDIEVLNLPELLYSMGYEHNYPIVNGMTFIWTVKLNKGSCTFIDTANYATTSLENMGKDIGIEKTEIDFNTTTEDALIEYCRNDTTICCEFMLKFIRFIQDNDLGSLKTTIASQALTAYRHRFMFKQPILHTHEDAIKIERAAYYGGRTECHYIGEYKDTEIYYLDINSQYPYAMLSPKIPTELLFYNDTPLFSNLLFHIQNNYIIADVTLETPLPSFPMRYKNKLIFPIGKPRLALHQAELEYALTNDLIRKVHRYAVYKPHEIFKDYVDFFYTLKSQSANEHNKAWYYMAKLFLNSLYGKFGQRYKLTELLGECNPFSNGVTNITVSETLEKYQEIHWFGKMYRTETLGESTFSFPAIAGAVTSNARMLLWSYMQIAGLENVYYTDTDSIITNSIGYHRLLPYIDDIKLGYLKLEATSDFIKIYGCKDYEIRDKIVHKGVPKSATQISADSWEYTRFIGFNEWRNSGASGSPVIWQQRKNRVSEYDKGKVLTSGKVIPFTFVGREIVG